MTAVPRDMLQTLRQQIETFEAEPMPVPPEFYAPTPIIHPPARPPRGGYPEDYQWDLLAAQHFAAAGEEPQTA